MNLRMSRCALLACLLGVACAMPAGPLRGKQVKQFHIAQTKGIIDQQGPVKRIAIQGRQLFGFKGKFAVGHMVGAYADKVGKTADNLANLRDKPAKYLYDQMNYARKCPKCIYRVTFNIEDPDGYACMTDDKPKCCAVKKGSYPDNPVCYESEACASCSKADYSVITSGACIN